jgi:hypothetical protein
MKHKYVFKSRNQLHVSAYATDLQTFKYIIVFDGRVIGFIVVVTLRDESPKISKYSRTRL